MKKSRRSSTKSGNGLWLITGLLVLIVAAGLYYLKNQPLPASQEQASKHAAAQHTKTAAENKPQFDFYTVLPGQKTANPTPAASTTAVTPPPVKTLPAPNSTQTSTKPAANVSGKYLLQIAAVKDFSQADSLKAHLTLQGYDVKITKIKVGSATWNRVDVGPYTSLSAAQTAQASLKKQNVKSILVK
jgi:cell division protein FtsN